MKALSSLLTALLLTAGALWVHGQDSVNVYNSGWKVQQGVKLHDEGKFDQALALYSSVNSNDSAYFWALAEKSLTLLKLKKYSETVDICRLALSIKTDKDPNIYVHLATALEELGRTAESVKVWDEGIQAFPSNYNLYYNKAVTLEVMKDTAAAVEYYKKALMANPFHPSSHLRLGHISADHGYYSQAMMSLIAYLMVGNNDSLKLETLDFLEKYMGQKYAGELPEINGLYEKEFSKTDMILGNMFSMHKDYKYKFKLDFSLLRQYQIFLQNLEPQADPKGFWMKYYVPFFARVLPEDQFEASVYLFLSSATKKKVRDAVSKHQKEVKSFSNWARQAWLLPYEHIDIALDPGRENRKIWRDGSLIQAMGEKNAGDLKQGRWVYFANDGWISSIGNYDQQGKKSGEWRYFFQNGNTSYIVEYQDNLANGRLQEFNIRGYKVREAQLADDRLNGVETRFFASGDTMELVNYKAGNMEGKSFSRHANGSPEVFSFYLNDRLEGKITKYHDNGKTEIEGDFKDGKREGSLLQYYRDGKPSKTETYSDDLSNGPIKEYYADGSVSFEGNLLKGKYTGETRNYYRNGKLKELCPYNDKGKIHGQLKYYDSDGLLHYTMDYENDVPVGYTCYDKSGKEVSGGKEVKNVLEVSIPYPEGGMMTKGHFVKGKKDGSWQYYNRYGGVKKEETYRDGLLEGRTTEFFKGGQAEKIFNYSKGQLAGLYTEYYLTGDLYATGTYDEGEMAGEWKYYDPQGVLSSTNYFHNGNYQGWQYSYDLYGKLQSKTEYHKGRILRDVNYDTLGNVITDASPAGYSGIVTLNYADGSKRGEYGLKNGNMDGRVNWYYPGGQADVSGQMFNGRRDGEWTYFFPDGRVRLKGRYTYGDKTGLWTEYMQDGKPAYEKNYTEGQEDGTYKEYDYAGNLYSSGTYSEGSQEGLFKYYSDNSHLMYMLMYHEGAITGYSYTDKTGKAVDIIALPMGTGTIKTYYANGKPSLEGRMENGIFKGTWTTYYDDGRVRSENTYNNGVLHGTSKFYYPGGQLRKSENYNMGYRNGMVSYYYPNGKIKEELMFNFDKRHNASKYYDENGKLLITRYYYNDDLQKESKE